MRIIVAGVIAGNPKTGRGVAAAAVALLLAMILFTALVAFRKRTAPLQQPPLHPAPAIAFHSRG